MKPDQVPLRPPRAEFPSRNPPVTLFRALSMKAPAPEQAGEIEAERGGAHRPPQIIRQPRLLAKNELGEIVVGRLQDGIPGRGVSFGQGIGQRRHRVGNQLDHREPMCGTQRGVPKRLPHGSASHKRSGGKGRAGDGPLLDWQFSRNDAVDPGGTANLAVLAATCRPPAHGDRTPLVRTLAFGCRAGSLTERQWPVPPKLNRIVPA